MVSVRVRDATNQPNEPTPTRTIATAVPPLESGDRLTRDEFHARYLLAPQTTRAELVRGVVYVSSPVSLDHATAHGVAVTWAGIYVLSTSGLDFADNGSLRLKSVDDTEVQPDVMIVREGQLQRFSAYATGVPALVFEVAASSASYDLHDKKAVYEQAGVPEYVVWLVYEPRLLWFRLVDGTYTEVLPNRRGIIESDQFPGLRLHVTKLLAGDYASVLATLTRTRGRRTTQQSNAGV